MFDILKNSGLFGNLTDEELGFLSKKLEEKKVLRNAKVFEQGDIGSSLFIVANGLVKISIVDSETHIEATLSTFKAGEYFGEMSLINESPRSAAAKAVIDTTLYEFSRSSLISISNENPIISMKIYHNISKILASRLGQTSKDLLKAMRAEPGKLKPTLNLPEYISKKTELKIVLSEGTTVNGYISRFGLNILDNELTIVSGGHEFIIPYSKIHHIELTSERKKSQKIY